MELKEDTIAVLEQIREEMEMAQSDIGAEDQMLMYLSPLLDKLDEYDMDEDEAVDTLMAIIEGLVEEGMLLPMPDEDADEAYIARWIGTAKSIGLLSIVCELMDEEDEYED